MFENQKDQRDLMYFFKFETSQNRCLYIRVRRKIRNWDVRVILFSCSKRNSLDFESKKSVDLYYILQNR